MVIRVTVEEGIPLPPQAYANRRGPKRRWPFLEMKAYDSFLVETGVPERESRLAYIAAKRVGVRIAIRHCEGGIRIWKMPPRERQG